MRYTLPFWLLILLALSFPAFGQNTSGCNSVPYALPTFPGEIVVCHEGYASGLDPAIKEPRVVEYVLTREQAIGGCLSRKGMNFKVDSLAPNSAQGKPKDYEYTQYDLGHFKNNEDGATTDGLQRETFTMTNVAPQLAGLNRQGWERSEDFRRVWAYQRGKLIVWVGSVIGPNAKTIGADKLPIPSAFYTVLYDPTTNEVLSYEMLQMDTPKMDDLSHWVAPLKRIENDSGLMFPIPADAKEADDAWPSDYKSWNAAHRSQCESRP